MNKFYHGQFITLLLPSLFALNLVTAKQQLPRSHTCVWSRGFFAFNTYAFSAILILPTLMYKQKTYIYVSCVLWENKYYYPLCIWFFLAWLLRWQCHKYLAGANKRQHIVTFKTDKSCLMGALFRVWWPGFLLRTKKGEEITKLFRKIPHTGDTNSLDRCG